MELQFNSVKIPRNITDEEKIKVEMIIEQLKPEIEEKAKNILENEIRDALNNPEKLEQIEREIKKGKKPKLTRKKGCIFLSLDEEEIGISRV